jgi:hypothetical protein
MLKKEITTIPSDKEDSSLYLKDEITSILKKEAIFSSEI